MEIVPCAVKSRMHKARFFLLLFILLLVFVRAGARESGGEKVTLKYPDINEERNQASTRYFLSLLNLALTKAGLDCSPEPVPLPYISENRSVRNLQSGTYTIHWLNSNIDRESGLVPVHVPLFKGLIGWRLLFIREEDQPQFSEIQTAKDLRAFVAGQGHDWPDTDVFEANEIKMVTSANFSGLFRMLPAKRIDYFPRSVVEIEREQKIFPDMYIEKELVLYYPSAYYFFMNNENAELAKKIEAGLIVAIEDGDFDKMFNKFYGDVIERANLQNRRVISLNNPQKFPLDQKAFWYRLPH